MNLRSAINQSPLATIGGVALVVLICTVLLIRGLRKNTVEPPSTLYFTIDNGKTLFTDDAKRLPPFEHDGKEAVLAKVFTADGGKTHFVGYLQKYTDEYKQAAGKPNAILSPALVATGILVKPPGNSEWLPANSPSGSKLMMGVKPPTGATGPIVAVYP